MCSHVHLTPSMPVTWVQGLGSAAAEWRIVCLEISTQLVAIWVLIVVILQLHLLLVITGSLEDPTYRRRSVGLEAKDKWGQCFAEGNTSALWLSQ